MDATFIFAGIGLVALVFIMAKLNSKPVQRKPPQHPKKLPPKFRPNESHISNRKGPVKQRKKVDHAPPPPVPSSMALKGRAWVIDGDTIIVNKIKIRLAGIDAPELDQPWGQKSKWEMVRICKGRIIHVKLSGETSYDRLVGTCFLADGRDIGAEIIKAGLALDGSYFSQGKYRHLECPEMRRKLKGYGHWR